MITTQAGLRRTAAALGAAALTAGLITGAISTAQATDDPVVSNPQPLTVVGLGDSYASGEGGRWAGNGATGTDALGRTAYFDSTSGRGRETIPGCHRSKSAPVHIGGGTVTINLACSGATTDSKGDGREWKPGIDFKEDRSRQGQAAELQAIATSSKVDVVVLSIGGNDFRFSDVITDCVTSFRGRLTACKDRDTAPVMLHPAVRNRIERKIVGAVENITQAMEAAGHQPSDWKLVVQTYPTPLANSKTIRYRDFLGHRSEKGGCPIRDDDADFLTGEYANAVDESLRNAYATAQRSNPDLRLQILNAKDAFKGHELCSMWSGRVGESRRNPDWTRPRAADISEWVTDLVLDQPQCSPNPFSSLPWCGSQWIKDTIIPLPESPAGRMQVESFHPNYWGQLALRNCLRQVIATDDLLERRCEPAGGLNEFGEPNMTIS